MGKKGIIIKFRNLTLQPHTKKILELDTKLKSLISER